LPHARETDRPGWQGEDGCEGFLWGGVHILPEGEIAAENDPRRITFTPISPGDAEVVSGLCSVGTTEGWRQAIEVLKDYPRAQVALYDSFAAPLLLLLGAPNHATNFGFPHSTGKTIAQMVAASAWGNPEERARGSFLHSWDSTTVGAERLCALHNGLPLILNDTSRVPKDRKHIIAEILYLAGNGRGRSRGAVQGAARTDTWFTSLISSSETALRNFRETERGRGGSVMRTIELGGFPFDRKDAETRAVVEALKHQLTENFGHAGPHSSATSSRTGRTGTNGATCTSSG
jgi:putative DNA primase/helicase